MILWAASVTGPQVPPGTYRVRMTVNDQPVGTETFKILPDPRIKATLADWQAQSALALQIRDRFSEANDAVSEIRRIRTALADRKGKLPSAQAGAFAAISGAFSTALTQVEDSLYQTQNRSGEDPLNFPIRLNNRIGALLGVVQSADGRPTQQSYQVYTVVSSELTKTLAKLKRVLDTSLPKVNEMLRAAGLEEITTKPGPIA
jgi:hypothetical protein